MEIDLKDLKNGNFIFDRNLYNYEMRRAFSSKDSILENGDINHKYFQTKVGQYWGIDQENLLLKGIEEFGVGLWDQIKHKYLKSRSETELKLRTCILLKLSNIDEYFGKKFTLNEIKKEAQKNEKEGIEQKRFSEGIYYNK